MTRTPDDDTASGHPRRRAVDLARRRAARRARAPRLHRQPAVDARRRRGPGRRRASPCRSRASRVTAPPIEDMIPTRWSDWLAEAERALAALQARRRDRPGRRGRAVDGRGAHAGAGRGPPGAGRHRLHQRRGRRARTGWPRAGRDGRGGHRGDGRHRRRHRRSRRRRGGLRRRPGAGPALDARGGRRAPGRAGRRSPSRCW